MRLGTRCLVFFAIGKSGKAPDHESGGLTILIVRPVRSPACHAGGRRFEFYPDYELLLKIRPLTGHFEAIVKQYGFLKKNSQITINEEMSAVKSTS